MCGKRESSILAGDNRFGTAGGADPHPGKRLLVRINHHPTNSSASRVFETYCCRKNRIACQQHFLLPLKEFRGYQSAERNSPAGGK